ncbi:SDR family NAD(P)-dependent oxidoreductase [Candidatus Margulisiibacteriota bacterium]
MKKKIIDPNNKTKYSFLKLFQSNPDYFNDKVAIVTGASSGIGEALVKELAAQGASVVLASRNEQKLQVISKEIISNNGKAAVFPVDVTDPDAVNGMVSNVYKRFGRIDMLFNNAGIGMVGEVRDMILDHWQKVINVNLMGVIYGINAVYPIMVDQGYGQIVNISSGTGLHPEPLSAAYAASKYAVTGLSQTLRLEAVGLGIKVNAVYPGLTDTKILENFTCINLDRKKIVDMIPYKAMSAQRCVQLILKGVIKNKADIILTRDEKLACLLNRISPSLISLFMKYYVNKFRAIRQIPE